MKNLKTKYRAAILLAALTPVVAILCGCHTLPKPPKGWERVSVNVSPFEFVDARYASNQLWKEIASAKLESLLLEANAFMLYEKKEKPAEYRFVGKIYDLGRTMKVEHRPVQTQTSSNTWTTVSKPFEVTTLSVGLDLKFIEPRSGRQIAAYSKPYSKSQSKEIGERGGRLPPVPRELRLNQDEYAAALNEAFKVALRDMLLQIYRELKP